MGITNERLIESLRIYADEARPFDEVMYDHLTIASRMLELLFKRVGNLRESSVDLLTAGDMLFEALREMYEGCIDDDLNGMSEEALMAWDKAKHSWSGES